MTTFSERVINLQPWGVREQKPLWTSRYILRASHRGTRATTRPQPKSK